MIGDLDAKSAGSEHTDEMVGPEPELEKIAQSNQRVEASGADQGKGSKRSKRKV